MKKLNSFFVGLFFLVLSLNANAQSLGNPDYFAGKWNIQVEGTPGGDSKMTLILERKDGKLGGIITLKEGSEPSRITRVEEKEKSVTVFFNTKGYDVYLLMEKKDDDNIAGSMMDMFDATGVRIKETASK